MGCSPSKGNPWAHTPAPMEEGGAVMEDPQQSEGAPQPGDGGPLSTAAGGGGAESTSVDLKETPMAPQEERRCSLGQVTSGVCSQGAEVHMAIQEEVQRDPSIEENLGNTTGGNPRGSKESKNSRQKDASVVKVKVDVSQAMVTAQKAAHAYLNPSICRYEALQGLLDQAAHTQLSLQPMVAYMVLRYDELNRSLEDMATEGEQLLKDHGERMSWPLPPRDHPSTAPGQPPRAPPDLMLQMLQHSTEKMRLVEESLRGQGDTTLQEAAEYFASLSELLANKLKAKRAAEGRFARVMAHIDAAAFQKPRPVDSALHSEDSGIGAESESLAGSERLRRHRESCESRSHPASSAQEGEIRKVPARKTSFSLNSLDSTFNNREQKDVPYVQASEDEEEEDSEDDDDDDDDEYDDEEEQAESKCRRRSNSSPPDPSQLRRHLVRCAENLQNVKMRFRMKDFDGGQRSVMRTKRADSLMNSAPQWTEEDEWQASRPQTACLLNDMNALSGSRPRSRSAESLHHAEDPTLLELDGSHATAPPGRGGGDNVGQVHTLHPPIRTRLHSSLDRNLPSQDRVELKTLHSKEEEKYGKVWRGPVRPRMQPSPPLTSTPPPGRSSVRRLIDTFSQSHSTQTSSNIQASLSKSRNYGLHTTLTGNGHVALITNGNNNNSYQMDPRATERPEDLDVDSLPPPPPEVLMDNSFECIPALLSSKRGDGLMRGRSAVPQSSGVSQRLRASLQTVTVLPSRGSLPPAHPLRQDHTAGARSGPDTLHPDADPEKEKAATLYRQARKIIHLRHAAESPVKMPLVNAGPGTRRGSDDPDMEPMMAYASSQHPTTPPVSRVRMPPSALPSPPAVRNPDPSVPLHPLKARSTSASPRVQRWTRQGSGEEGVLRPSSPSPSFSNARSVFCHSSTPSEPPAWTSYSNRGLPRPYGEPSRGRLPLSVCSPQPFVRRSRSDHRPSATQSPKPPEAPATTEAKSSKSEPIGNSQEQDLPSASEEKHLDSQSDLRAPSGPAPQTELCTVGQA